MTNALWQRLACLCEGTGLTLHPGDVCQCGNTEVMQRAKPADQNINHIREEKKNKTVLILATLRAPLHQCQSLLPHPHVSVETLLGVFFLLLCSFCCKLYFLTYFTFSCFSLFSCPCGSSHIHCAFACFWHVVLCVLYFFLVDVTSSLKCWCDISCEGGGCI